MLNTNNLTNMNVSTNYSSTNDPLVIPNSGFAVMMTINIIGIVGNFLLIVAHVKDPQGLLKSSSSPFIFNIASMDMLLSSVMFTRIAFTLREGRMTIQWNSSNNSIAFSLTSLGFSVLFASYLSLAIERFLSVAYPLWHRARITVKVSRYWVLALWITSAGMGTIYFAVNRVTTEVESQMSFLSFICLMLLLILCVYIASYISIRRQSLHILSRTDMNEVAIRTTKIRLKNEKNFLVTIALVCCVLAVTILPYVAISFVFWIDFIEENHASYPPEYFKLVLFFIGSNSAANVFVYLWRLPKYRKTFKKLYCDC